MKQDGFKLSGKYFNGIGFITMKYYELDLDR